MRKILPKFFIRLKSIMGDHQQIMQISTGSVVNNVNNDGKGKQQQENDIPYVLTNEKDLFKGRWLGAKQVDFHHKRSDHQGIWQIAYRTSTPADVAVEGVAVIPLVLESGGKQRSHVMLIKQYRIPLRRYTLEFPAGLLDSGEDAVQAGLRELKEETGYTSTKVVRHTKGRQPLDPGLTDDSINFVICEIDMKVPENQNPRQNLLEGEEVEVVLVPIEGALEALDRYTDSGLLVDATVYSFVFGYVMGRNLL